MYGCRVEERTLLFCLYFRQAIRLAFLFCGQGGRLAQKIFSPYCGISTIVNSLPPLGFTDILRWRKGFCPAGFYILHTETVWNKVRFGCVEIPLTWFHIKKVMFTLKIIYVVIG